MNETQTIRPRLPDPHTAPQLFENLLTRRVSAFIIDTVLIGVLTLALSLFALLAGFVTFGLAWLALVFIVPISIAVYYALTLGSARRATIGMQFMDIVLTPTRGAPLDGWTVLLHAGLFWVTFWISLPLSLLVALFTPRRQMLHDLVTGTLMVRRSPMERHWRSQNVAGNAVY